jgi:hypothetical protein
MTIYLSNLCKAAPDHNSVEVAVLQRCVVDDMQFLLLYTPPKDPNSPSASNFLLDPQIAHCRWPP